MEMHGQRTWPFHVVALQRTAKKCTKNYNACAQLLFCSSNLCLLNRRRRGSLKLPIVTAGNQASCPQQHRSFNVKVSANPKLTVLHDFGFLYKWINLRKSFRLKNSTKKCYSYGRLFSENNFAVVIMLISR